jgi:putative phage-type endonuclease
MDYLNIAQRTAEWDDARRGKVTASALCDVMATLRSGEEPAARRNYRMKLLCERLTGFTQPTFQSEVMKRGAEMEAIARGQYEGRNGIDVVQVAFVDHPSIEMFGASPDSYVGTDGLVEIKCPQTATHVHFITTGEIDYDYQWQMIGQMVCTGRRWCDFVSFDDRLPDRLQYRCKRYHLDIRLATTLEQSVIRFLGEVAELEARMRALM